MGVVLLDVTMSLDGFIAGPNDDVERLHDWLFSGQKVISRGGGVFRVTEGDAEVLAEAFKTTGAVVMGRRMFDIGEKPWGDNPPFQVPCFVALMGANTAQQYMKAGLLDEIQIHLVPVLLGEGIRLFEDIGTEQIELERTSVKQSPDVTHLRFRVPK